MTGRPDGVLNLAALFDKEGLLAVSPKFRAFESEYLSMDDWNVISIVRRLEITASARPGRSDRPLSITYWAAFKDEFRLLMCTKDEQYKGLRDAIERSTDKSQTTLVSMMAGALSGYLGVAAGSIIPLVVLCMVVVVKLGIGAFCRLQNLDDIRPFKRDV
jgi:hypothetical protein